MPDYSSVVWSESIESRFWSKVLKTENGCWEWIGYVTLGGYGQFSIGNVHYAAHRLLKVKMVGPIPIEMVCDHLCRNRRCVNPSHIDIVSNRENLIRGLGPQLLNRRNKSITHCPHGHEYKPDNTRISAKGSRSCRTCDRIRGARWTAIRAEFRARAAAARGERPIQEQIR